MADIFKPIVQLVSPVLSAIFGIGDEPSKQQPTPPAVTPPTPMPTPDDEKSRAAKRASLVEQQRRRGRASTILTEPSDTLG